MSDAMNRNHIQVIEFPKYLLMRGWKMKQITGKSPAQIIAIEM